MRIKSFVLDQLSAVSLRECGATQNLEVIVKLRSDRKTQRSQSKRDNNSLGK